MHTASNTFYKVACYPQSSGNFASSRLDSLQLDIAHIGSTPWAQAVARGVDAKQIYISHYMGESQGIYVRPDEQAYNYTGIVTPYDLRGRTVGVPFGSTTHFQLLFLIDLLKLKGTVTVLDMSPRGKHVCIFINYDCIPPKTTHPILTYCPPKTFLDIMAAWDADPPRIDAAACWGTARSHILDPEGARPAETLLSSGVISEYVTIWCFPTSCWFGDTISLLFWTA